MASKNRNKANLMSDTINNTVNDVNDVNDVRKTITNKRLQALQEEPWAFDFYYAMRVLECCLLDADEKQYPRIGTTRRVKDEVVRLGQQPSTAFAPATVASFQTSEQKYPQDKKNQDKESKNKKDLDNDNEEYNRWYLSVFFQGLFGANGPLPLHLTEYARSRMRSDRDPVMTEFMDLFHHRLLSLFYRAWANKEPTIQYDRPDEDRFRLYIGSLFGSGTDVFKQQDAMPDNSKLYFAAHLANKTRHADGLLSMLSQFFQIPISMEEFVGEWLEIPTDSRCALGQSIEGGRLGQDTTLGIASWQRQFKFRLYIGPVSLVDYLRFMPGEKALSILATIIRNYLGDELNWEVNLILKKEEIPAMQLGQVGQLGRTCWLKDKAAQNDANDLYLQASQAKVRTLMK